MVATRGAERRRCPYHGPSPQRWPFRGDAARGAAGGGARHVRRPTGTEGSTSGGAAGEAPSLSVVPVSDDRIDDAALQFLLQQSLLARAEKEEVQQLEQVEEEVVKYKGRDWFGLSDLKKAAVTLVAHSNALTKRRERKRRAGDGPASSSSDPVNIPVVPETLWVRIVILVVKSST